LDRFGYNGTHPSNNRSNNPPKAMKLDRETESGREIEKGRNERGESTRLTVTRCEKKNRNAHECPPLHGTGAVGRDFIWTSVAEGRKRRGKTVGWGGHKRKTKLENKRAAPNADNKTKGSQGRTTSRSGVTTGWKPREEGRTQVLGK